MSYCSKGQKATIVYSFNGVERRYVTENTPIDVAIYQHRINASDNYREEGFGIRFYSPNNFSDFEAPIRDYQIFPSPDFDYGPNYEGISIWDCDETGFSYDSRGNLTGPGIDITTLVILPHLKCPKPLKNRCSIEIKHNNIIIFQDQGECPIGFDVICGDCPEGTFKCNQSGYPGYCCLPCESLASGVKSITNIVNQLNQKGSVSRG